jgi:hypothetical protein
MEVQLAVLCDDAHVSPEGKLDIRGIFNELSAPGFPAKQDQMILVVSIEWGRADQGRYQFRVDLMSPEEKPVLTVEGHTDVDLRGAERPPAQTRLIMPLSEVIFPVPGRYRFSIRVKGKEVGGPSLYLSSAAEPATNA